MKLSPKTRAVSWFGLNTAVGQLLTRNEVCAAVTTHSHDSVLPIQRNPWAIPRLSCG